MSFIHPMTFITLPKKATAFPIHTNPYWLGDHNFGTAKCLEIIEQHPMGITLTELAPLAIKGFHDNNKSLLKEMIDPLLVDDLVRKYTPEHDERLRIYVPTRISKRFLFKQLVKAFIDAKN